MALCAARASLAIGVLLAMLPTTAGGFQADAASPPTVLKAKGALAGERYRVVVSTDVGGTDPDDFQSLVHLLLYADCLELEGLISSPYGPGRKEHILQVIDSYAQDFTHLRRYSAKYPTPDSLREITKQGETETAPYAGVRRATEGSRWLVECARRADPRPLYVLVWGGIEDLAQALHDAPDILPKLRVYFIGGPNKKWGPNAYHYLATHHPTLWIIEANSTYRGWFTGGEQTGQWNNREFVAQHVAGHGALGQLFVAAKDELKMGDSPSVGWLLRGDPEDPSQPGWGGSFVRAWERPYVRIDQLPAAEQRMEIFGILELVLSLPTGGPQQPQGQLIVDNQSLEGYAPGDGTLRFRFCPKAATTYRFTLRSNVAELDGQVGGITAIAPAVAQAVRSAAHWPHWWTDELDPNSAEEQHSGSRTVSRWRTDFLSDFLKRLDRCASSHK